ALAGRTRPGAGPGRPAALRPAWRRRLHAAFARDRRPVLRPRPFGERAAEGRLCLGEPAEDRRGDRRGIGRPGRERRSAGGVLRRSLSPRPEGVRWTAVGPG